jgi:hypothetical protein
MGLVGLLSSGVEVDVWGWHTGAGLAERLQNVNTEATKRLEFIQEGCR